MADKADRIDPAAMTPGQVARMLTVAGGKPVAEQTVRRHIEAGAPATADGRMNLVHYAAWLIRRIDETEKTRGRP